MGKNTINNVEWRKTSVIRKRAVDLLLDVLDQCESALFEQNTDKYIEYQKYKNKAMKEFERCKNIEKEEKERLLIANIR